MILAILKKSIEGIVAGNEAVQPCEECNITTSAKLTQLDLGSLNWAIHDRELWSELSHERTFFDRWRGCFMMTYVRTYMSAYINKTKTATTKKKNKNNKLCKNILKRTNEEQKRANVDNNYWNTERHVVTKAQITCIASHTKGDKNKNR